MKAGFHLHQSLSDAQTFALQVVNAGGTAKVDTDYSRGGLPHAVAYTLPDDTPTCNSISIEGDHCHLNKGHEGAHMTDERNFLLRLWS